MGNVYMEADQVRFKNSTYHNLQTAVSAALEGGGGGGTTVVANPEGSATADLAKLQVGETIYGIPAEGGSGPAVISGTTNIQQIKWLRYGNVVIVTSNGAAVTTAGTSITGLPLPYGGAYQVGACYNQASMVANIIYDSNNGWRIVGTGSGSPSAFGSLAYIAADN